MKNILIKIGGNAASQLTPAFFETIKHWQKNNYNITIVHGGGDSISSLMTQLNEPVVKIDGIRQTTPAGLAITKMALLGQVQPDLVEAFRHHGLSDIGLNAGSNQLLTGHYINQEVFGLVGQIDQVNSQLIQSLWQQNLIPIIAPLAITNQGQWLNVNADSAATAVAKFLKSDELYLLTDVSGIEVHGNILQQLTPQRAIELQTESVIHGGMLPKVNSAFSAVKNGVNAVHITNTIASHGTTISM